MSDLITTDSVNLYAPLNFKRRGGVYKEKYLSWFRTLLKLSPTAKIQRNIELEFEIHSWGNIPLKFQLPGSDGEDNESFQRFWRNIIKECLNQWQRGF